MANNNNNYLFEKFIIFGILFKIDDNRVVGTFYHHLWHENIQFLQKKKEKNNKNQGKRNFIYFLKSQDYFFYQSLLIFSINYKKKKQIYISLKIEKRGKQQQQQFN